MTNPRYPNQRPAGRDPSAAVDPASQTGGAQAAEREGQHSRAAVLYLGEDAEEYADIQQNFFATINPAPGTETMLVSTLVDLTREIHQLEKMRTTLIRIKLHEDIAELLVGTDALEGTGDDVLPIADAQMMLALARQWAYGSRGAEEEVAERLTLKGLSLDVIMQQGYARALDEMKKLNGLVERAELRRDRVLRTFDQSRALRALVRIRELQVRLAESNLIDAETVAAARHLPNTIV